MDGYSEDGCGEMPDGSEAAWLEMDPGDPGEADGWMGTDWPCASGTALTTELDSSKGRCCVHPVPERTLSDGCVLLGRILLGLISPQLMTYRLL